MKLRLIVLAASIVVGVLTVGALHVAAQGTIDCPYSYSVAPEPDQPDFQHVTGQSTTSCSAQTSMDTYSTLQYATSASGPFTNLGTQHEVCGLQYQCNSFEIHLKANGTCGYYYRTVGDHYWWNGSGHSYKQTISTVSFDYC
jgi:hypothetical protein